MVGCERWALGRIYVRSGNFFSDQAFWYRFPAAMFSSVL